MNWTFDQEQNVATLSTKQVINEGYPVLQVIHYSDDHSWAFLCGTTSEPHDAMTVSMAQAVATDHTLYEIADLPPGWVAIREAVGSHWQRFQDDDI